MDIVVVGFCLRLHFHQLRLLDLFVSLLARSYESSIYVDILTYWHTDILTFISIINSRGWKAANCSEENDKSV